MIACPNCRTIQPVEHLNTGRLSPCSVCRAPLRVDLFRGFFRRFDQTELGEDVHAQTQAQCFNHPGKKAVAPCIACGRLLCALCRVELEDQNYCMSCLQAGRDKRKLKNLQQQRTLFDSIALNLAFWPMLAVFPTLLTAPAALYFAVRHWRAPAGIFPRTHLKNIFAVLLAAGQIIGWIAAALFFLTRQ